MDQFSMWDSTPASLIEKKIESTNCPIHYWINSAKTHAPTLVMLHGATMDHRMFNAQVPALQQDYNIIAWDARGHGKSRPLTGNFILQDCAADLMTVLKEEKVSKVILVGQSMGGYIAQFFYLLYPDWVRALAIIGSTSIAFAYPKWQIWALKASLSLFNLWPYQHFTKTVATSTALNPAVRKYALEVIRSLDRQTFQKIWEAVTVAVNETGIPGHRINVPLLITHGDRDNTGVIRKQAPTWVKYEPDVTYTVIPDASHNANQDNPDYFNQILINFLTKIT
jgi:pimeloyl-ACP methyl ester carboxylesterase